jgi:phosphoribosylaminoimidazolecarboxamide formyltransferase/IMP cyclohydrolase
MKKIGAALISVFNKEGLDSLVRLLHEQGVLLFSTGGTEQFIRSMDIPCRSVEKTTGFPSILGGRVKTLHPKIFGGILARREKEEDLQAMEEYGLPCIDLVIVDLYPFEETVASTTDEKAIIEKIDIGGPSMIRAAAKNHAHVAVVAERRHYEYLEELLRKQNGCTTIEQRRDLAVKAFDRCTAYDFAISNYFHQSHFLQPFGSDFKTLRYGENPHQSGLFTGNLDEWFVQQGGKELSYNNLVDTDAAVQLMEDLRLLMDELDAPAFCCAILKHTNVCGCAIRTSGREAWEAALAGDPESAFGGVIICNKPVDFKMAEAIHPVFFEVLIAPGFEDDALQLLVSRKNRILLRQKEKARLQPVIQKSLLNGILLQETDQGNYLNWNECGAMPAGEKEKQDLLFANLLCKHLKSNAIALVQELQLIGKGCGQTSRIDALRHALAKAEQFQFRVSGAVMASDAFFPFDDCVKLAHQSGIGAFIQPGGSIRDEDSNRYCRDNGLVMVMTGLRHFKH